MKSMKNDAINLTTTQYHDVINEKQRGLSIALFIAGAVACTLFIWIDAFRYPLPPQVFLLTLPYLPAGTALVVVGALAFRYGHYLRGLLFFSGLAVVCALV